MRFVCEKFMINAHTGKREKIGSFFSPQKSAGSLWCAMLGATVNFSVFVGLHRMKEVWSSAASARGFCSPILGVTASSGFPPEKVL